MKTKKLYIQLKSLSVAEMKDLQKAVNSPYFNSNPSVTLLFKKLKRQHPDFDDSLRGSRVLYKKLFPDEAFNDGKLRRLFTFLSQVVERFIVAESIDRQPALRLELLSEEYERRNLPALFQRENYRLETAQNENPIKDADWHLRNYEMLMSRYSSLSHEKYNPQDDTLQRAGDDLDTYWCLQKIRLEILQKSREQIFNEKKPAGFLPLPSEETGWRNALTALYFQALDITTEQRGTDFGDYEKRFADLEEGLSEYDRPLFFITGLNYLIRRGNRGEANLSGSILRWYDKGIKKGYLLINNRISAPAFGNYIFHACKQKDFTAAENFIAGYAHLLPAEVRADEVAYSRSVILFTQKKYDAVVLGLSGYEFSLPYILKTRILILKTYFELFLQDEDTYTDLVFSALKSYENYLHRNDTFSPQYVAGHRNFIVVLRRLLHQMRSDTPRKELSHRLRKELMHLPGMPGGQNWLEELIRRFERS